MSLRITNKATDKQVAMLKKLGYYGIGQYAPDKLSKEEAAQLIDELFDQQDEQTNEYPDIY